jgi:hypothetical protein
MDSKRPEHIEKLLEKYWNCDSTLEEEQELKSWFLQRKEPSGSDEEELLFRYYDLEKKKEVLSDSFDDEVIHSISSNKRKKGKRLFMSPAFRNISKIAAGVVVAVAATFVILREEEPELPAVFMTDTYENPEEAYEETLKVLNLISQKLNVGKKHAAKISVFSEAEEAVKEEAEIN